MQAMRHLFGFIVFLTALATLRVDALFSRRVLCSRISKEIQQSFAGEWACICFNPPLARLVVSCTSTDGKIESFIIGSFVFMEFELFNNGRKEVFDITFLRPGRKLRNMRAVECNYEIDGSKCASCVVTGTLVDWDVKADFC